MGAWLFAATALNLSNGWFSSHGVSGPQVRLIYYPPDHSKYNPIERCWGAALENYWNGAILQSVEEAVREHLIFANRQDLEVEGERGRGGEREPKREFSPNYKIEMHPAVQWVSNMTWKGIKPLIYLVEGTYEKNITVPEDELAEYKQQWNCSDSLPKWYVNIIPS